MVKSKYELSFPSDYNKVKAIISTIMRFVQNKIPHLDYYDFYDIKLIISELLCNAVIHGNQKDIQKKVTVQMEIADGAITCMVRDEGPGFNYWDLLSEYTKEKNLKLDHGRGIIIVSSLADSLKFNNEGNEITFYKKVNTYGQNPYMRQHCSEYRAN